MKGEEVKKKLIKSGYLLKDVAAAMNETPQNLNSMLKADDIKTGVLEKIALAINKSLYFFIGDGDENIGKTIVVPIEAMDIMKKQADSLARKDDQIDDLILILKNQIKENQKKDTQHYGGDNVTSVVAG